MRDKLNDDCRDLMVEGYTISTKCKSNQNKTNYNKYIAETAFLFNFFSGQAYRVDLIKI